MEKLVVRFVKRSAVPYKFDLDFAFDVDDKTWEGLKDIFNALADVQEILGDNYDLDRLREQVEKVWRGEWEDMRESYNDVPKRCCSRCKSVFIGLDTPFCEVCGAPMTDEAVDMVMERLEALHGET